MRKAETLIDSITNREDEFEVVFTKNREFEIELYFYVTRIYPHMGDYKKALRWNNKIINKKLGNVRKDLKNISLILNLIIHFELKNYDLLSYRIVSVKNNLKNNLSPFKGEKIIIDSLNKITNLGLEEIFVVELKELKSKLEELNKDKFETRFFDYFDFISWIERKINLVSV